MSFWNKGPSIPETTNIFSPHISDSISRTLVNKDLALPIINVVENENVELRGQMDKIAQELKKLDGLSEGLTNENARLRSHYYERNNDLQNFIHTFRIDLADQLSDINHQIHLLREGNCLAFKAIQAQMTKGNEFSERINILKNKLHQLSQESTGLQEGVLFPLRVRLQNKLNSNTIRTLTQTQQKLTQNQRTLWEEVGSLAIAVNHLQKNNFVNAKEGMAQKGQNSEDKSFYKNNIVHALKSVAELKEVLVGEKAVQLHMTEKYNNLKEKLEKLEAEKSQKNAEKQRKELQFRDLETDRQFQINANIQTGNNIQQLAIKIMEKTEQRAKLEKELQEKKKARQNLKQKHEQQKQAIVSTTSKQMQEIRGKIKQVNNNFNFELKRAQSQWEMADETIASLGGELKEMEKDIDYYSSKCRGLDNPVRAIEKAEFKLKYVHNKKGPSLRA